MKELRQLQMFIKGQWRMATDGAIELVWNPATEEPIASVALGAARDVDLAVAAAAKASATGPKLLRACAAECF